MRDGKVSFFKFGGSTRFKRENLDMVARKVTAKEEGAATTQRCAACGHGFLVAGDVRSTGRLYFQPRKTKFFVLSDSMILTEARACPVCGHVQLVADTEKLAKLMTEADAAASAEAGADAEPQAEEES
jgi:ribosomal protein S27AE